MQPRVHHRRPAGSSRSRRLLNLVTALSLLLCVAVVAQWMRSSRGAEVVGFERLGALGDAAVHRALYLESSSGAIWAGRWWAEYYGAEGRAILAAGKTNGWRPFRRTYSFGSFPGSRRPPTLLQRLGFDARGERTTVVDEDDQRVTTAREHSAFAVPYWLLAVPAALLPLARAVKPLRRVLKRDRRPGLCPRCGYDLRASPDCCPECGEPAPTASLAGGLARRSAAPETP